MKNFILIIFVLCLAVSCGKKGDPAFENSSNIIGSNVIKS